MLGRLFQQSSSSNVTSPPPATTPTDTYDNSHTRSFLYGNAKPLKPINFNHKQFRLVISQDGGNLRSKQVLYDSNKLSEQNFKKLQSDKKKDDKEANGCYKGGDLVGNDYKQLERSNNYENLHSMYKKKEKEREQEKEKEKSDKYDRIRNDNDNKNYFNDKNNEKNINDTNDTNSQLPLPSKYLKSDPNYDPKKDISLINSYNLSNINDYMFGCGLPSNESCSVTKIHILPQLNNRNWSILITRLFSISNDENFSVRSSDWSVYSTLPINQSIQSPTTKSGTINSRFALGIIIPLQHLNELQDLICLNWIELSYYLLNLQKFIYKKLIHHLNLDINQSNIYIINKRIQFSNYILQQDTDINQYLLKFIKLFHFINIPKLINCNNLISQTLVNNYQTNNSKNYQFKSLLFNWLMEILNWLNFKDGNDGFLPSLFALILPVKDNLAIKPYQFINKDQREVTRIVIMTSNPTIVKKLIFIINGLIPSNDFIIETKDEEPEDNSDKISLSDKNISRNSSFTNPNNINRTNSQDSMKKHHNHRTFHLTSPSNLTKIHKNSEKQKQKNHEEDLESIRVNDTYLSPYKSKSAAPYESITQSNSPIKPISIGIPRKNSSLVNSYVGTPILENSVLNDTSLPYPIPMRSQDNYGSPTSFDNSPNHSSPLIKGWEIPGKSTVSTTTTNFSIIDPICKNIPISSTRPKSKDYTHPTLSKSASMAYLSTSLNSSLSSSTSKYSLNNFGGSFLDKWKNSMGNNHSNQNTPGYSFDEYFPPPPPKRNSFQSHKSYSPAIEHDDFNWQAGTMSLSSSVGKSQPITPTKLSRAQSILEMNNINNEFEQLINENKIGMNMNLSRTNSGIYSPIMNDDKDVHDHNHAMVIKRTQSIMKKNIVIKKVENNILEVECLPREEDHHEYIDIDDDEDIYDLSEPDQSTITSMSLSQPNSSIIKLKHLNPNVSFTEEFRPEFNLQSCPPSIKLEQQIMSTMKQDLLFYQNYFHYEQIITRTILVSLRAREIKQIEMRINNKGLVESPQEHPSQFSIPNAPKPINNTYHTKIKKVYTPTKNIGNLQLIQFIEGIFGEIDQLINYNKNKNEEFYNQLIKLIKKLLSYKE